MKGLTIDFRAKRMELPINYETADWQTRANAREQYIEDQKGQCMFCKTPLGMRPEQTKEIDWSLFPGGEEGFLRYPVHLQHNHDTGMSEGAVHSYCNAVLWQYHGR